MSVARQVIAWLEEGWPHLPDLTEEDYRSYENKLAAELRLFFISPQLEDRTEAGPETSSGKGDPLRLSLLPRVGLSRRR